MVRHAEIIEMKNPMSQPMAVSKDPALDLPLSGWWRRFGSGIADTIIAWALTFAMLAIATPDFLSRLWSVNVDFLRQIKQAATGGQVVIPGTPWQTANSYFLLILGGVTAVYCIVFLGTWGATLGQRLLGIKVVKAPLPVPLIATQTNYTFHEEKPGWLRSISKGLGWALFSSGGQLFILVQLANALVPLWHKRKQSVTDLFAGTLVIRNTPTKKDT